MRNNINIASHKEALLQGIRDFEEIEKVLLEKRSSEHLYINTAAGEVRIFMVTLLLYLIGRNPYYSPVFHEEFFISLLQQMHRACISSLHISVEAALSKIIKSKKIEPEQSLFREKIKIIERINNKLPKKYQVKIAKELQEFQHLGGKHVQFDDYLEAVLKSVRLFEDTKRDKDYKRGARAFFRALSIVRNKQSHFNQVLTKIEKNDLKKGGLSKLIEHNGSLRMSVSYYKPIFNDVIKFFNLITEAKMIKLSRSKLEFKMGS